MAKAKGKGLSLTSKIIIASVVVVGAGVGLYFLLRKKSRSEESKETGTADAGAGSSTGGKQEKKVDVPSQCKPKKAPTELKTAGLVADFQEWLDKTHPLWYLDKKTGKYTNICVKNVEGKVLDSGKYCGQYGCGTEKAWGIWGAEYKKLKGSSTSTATTTSTTTNTSLSLNPPKALVGDNLSSLSYKPIVPTNISYAYTYFEGDKYEPTSGFTPEQLDLNL
jgi:hypothetical protein